MLKELIEVIKEVYRRITYGVPELKLKGDVKEELSTIEITNDLKVSIYELDTKPLETFVAKVIYKDKIVDEKVFDNPFTALLFGIELGVELGVFKEDTLLKFEY